MRGETFQTLCLLNLMFHLSRVRSFHSSLTLNTFSITILSQHTSKQKEIIVHSPAAPPAYRARTAPNTISKSISLYNTKSKSLKQNLQTIIQITMVQYQQLHTSQPKKNVCEIHDTNDYCTITTSASCCSFARWTAAVIFSGMRFSQLAMRYRRSALTPDQINHCHCHQKNRNFLLQKPPRNKKQKQKSEF